MKHIYIALFLCYCSQTASAQTEGAEAVHKLSILLTQHCKNDFQKVEVLYDWITNNIRYDHERYNLIDPPVLIPDSVLARRQGVCLDYAALAKEMLDAVGIKCVVVNGIAKQDEEDIVVFNPSEKKHAWNAVYLNNKWQLFDCTWGFLAKITDNTNKRFFLVPPERMIFTHYPDDRQWALINRKISFEEFVAYPIVHSYFIYTGVMPPKVGILNMDEDSLIISNIGLSNIKDSLSFSILPVVDGTNDENASIELIGNSQLHLNLKARVYKKGKYYLQVFKDESKEELTISKLLITFLINKR